MPEIHHSAICVHDVVVIGAGFGGLTAAHRLAEAGIDDVVIVERSDGVGGTWRANTYPGAACDVPSHLYSLSFAPNPNWSRAFATQPEILAYVEDCYDRLDVRRKVRTGVVVDGLRWDEHRRHWTVTTRDGTTFEAPVVVSAVGMFHTPKWPAIDGLADFSGTVFHSARWDHDHDLTGERVAVIGTGASAIQIVPAIAERVAHLDVYQRTAPWILPRKDEPYSPEQQQRFAEDPAEALAHRKALHDMFEQNTSFLTDDPGGAAIAQVARDYLAHKVPDPGLRARLTPTHPFGCTRTLISSDYYPAVQRDDVDLATEGIDRITTDAVVTVDGVARTVDTIVLCTGFHATDYLRGIDVVGRGGLELHEHWAGTPRAYHGLTVPGFPNLFMLYGPNTNQGGNSILLMLEAQAQFVAASIEAMRAAGADVIEVTPEAMADYERDLEQDLARTVWVDGCSTYFHTATGDVVTQLPHTSGWYREATRQIDPDHFVFTSAPASVSEGAPGRRRFHLREET